MVSGQVYYFAAFSQAQIFLSLGLSHGLLIVLSSTL